MASPAYQALLAPWLANMANRPATLELATLRAWMSAPTAPLPGTRVIPTTAGGVPAEWVCAPGADPARRVLYLHGGGYVSGSPANYREFTSMLSAALGRALLAPDYRLGPEHPFPAAVDDAVAACGWLRAQGPDGPAPAAATVVMGDSAGGGLTVATVLALRDAGLPLPNGAVSISGYFDLAHTGASVHSRADADPVNRPAWLDTYGGNYLCGADPRHPLASPLYADFTGLPPMLLQVGDAEIIRDDTPRVAARARTFGVDARDEVWPEMIHVWHLRQPPFPEAQEAIAHIRAFIEEVAG